MSSADLISKRTRNAFREELVGWTLGEISTEFDNEGFAPDFEHQPGVGGQRRGLVEQLYHRIDFADPRQAARRSASIAWLKRCWSVLASSFGLGLALITPATINSSTKGPSSGPSDPGPTVYVQYSCALLASPAFTPASASSRHTSGS